ncbi:MAG: glycoside hydrolase family 2 [Salinibacterium sp.]|nr:glycoside hydrolase family 2 TIM barrel-domain containing protein [Salinibacterium sp.]MBF0670962.1 glycoside hydrolase family 2 [Salinibacterium sp.]
MHASTTPEATPGEPLHPRPQLTREHWASLDGEWDFAHDDADIGLRESWFEPGTEYPRTIRVPFPPESEASGIGDTGFHPVVWYRREVTADDLRNAGHGATGERVLLHFGAVDYRATAWLDGRMLGAHEGGQSPFAFELPPAQVAEILGGRSAALVVRAEDDPHDVGQPRGKQDWLEQPHVIWYHRTTGIWQPVWLEAVPPTSIRKVHWRSDIPSASVRLELELDARPRDTHRVRVELSYEGERLAALEYEAAEPRSTTSCELPRQVNGQAYEHLLWSPEHPRLIDARVSLLDQAGVVVDVVDSYLGLRSLAEADGRFLLNDRPYYVRSVLSQGYWPESHLAAPSADALRDEVALMKELGFNAARLHEKAEDPRMLYWADRLGLLVWGELGSPFEYSARSVERTTSEWMAIVDRDRSHPCIVTWVPTNESWGVQHIAHDPAQRHFAQALYHLSKALDPERLVVSNDGWEHVGSDLLTVHDYSASGDELRQRYGDAEAITTLAHAVGPAGRRMSVAPQREDVPVMVTEFGGVSFAPGEENRTWGYSIATDEADFERRLRELFAALQSSSALAGFCYTQLTDTLQEANGLTDARRIPKLPAETIAAIVRGDAS